MGNPNGHIEPLQFNSLQKMPPSANMQTGQSGEERVSAFAVSLMHETGMTGSASHSQEMSISSSGKMSVSNSNGLNFNLRTTMTTSSVITAAPSRSPGRSVYAGNGSSKNVSMAQIVAEHLKHPSDSTEFGHGDNNNDVDVQDEQSVVEDILCPVGYSKPDRDVIESEIEGNTRTHGHGRRHGGKHHVRSHVRLDKDRLQLDLQQIYAPNVDSDGPFEYWRQGQGQKQRQTLQTTAKTSSVVTERNGASSMAMAMGDTFHDNTNPLELNGQSMSHYEFATLSATPTANEHNTQYIGFSSHSRR